MEHVITGVYFTRRGVKRFEKEVNDFLDNGFKVCSISVEKRGLRFVCYCWMVSKC